MLEFYTCCETGKIPEFLICCRITEHKCYNKLILQPNLKRTAFFRSKMHGVKKSDLTKEKLELMRKNVVKYKQLNEAILAQKKAKVYNEEMLSKCSQILAINSEHYTIWNYRREILLNLFESKEDELKSKLLLNELAVVEKALFRNPKSLVLF